MRNPFLILLFLFFLYSNTLKAQQVDTLKAKQWVDSVLSTMSLEDRIGQLFMIAAWSNKDAEHTKEIVRQVKDNRIGGLCFFRYGEHLDPDKRLQESVRSVR